MIRAGIIGASGYTGGELMRLLARHPEAEVVAATSRKLAGTRVASEHRFLEGFSDLMFEDISNEEIKNMCDVIFLAVPHGTAMNYVPELLEDSKCRIIDLSADYRLDTK
ncbi:MAG: Gfo/Idh/MocA family oxidoreductase, partial [Methanosarcinaceae archaeon]|nr:Gfo/Idh/MocA family oxidoreductase [Methanosarcinaceae archaeon]